MTDFMEIVHDDSCYICDKKDKDLLNFNDDILGYGRFCHGCIGSLLVESLRGGGPSKQ